MAYPQPETLDWEEGDPWLMEEYGGKPIEPRRLIADEDEEDFARISLSNYFIEPLVWAFAGVVLYGTAWRSGLDILGYWMVLFVMLPLRMLDTDRPRDRAFHRQYITLQLLALGAGMAGWYLTGWYLARAVPSG